MRRQPNVQALQKAVDQFNASFPVGTRVILRKDTGHVETTVWYPAEVLQGHSAVAWFTDVSGCYDIQGRVTAAQPVDATPAVNAGVE